MDTQVLACALRCYRHRRALPSSVHALRCLSEYNGTHARSNAFFHLLSDHARRMLSQWQTPPSGDQPEEELAALRAAFTVNNLAYQQWGILFWRYFHPQRPISVSALAKLIGDDCDPMLIRQRLWEGLGLLAEFLEESEQNALRQQQQIHQGRARQRLQSRPTQAQQQSIERLYDMLQDAPRLYLEGLGGIGTSSFASYLCEHLKQTHHTIWINAQPHWLDPYGRLRVLPYAAHSAAEVIDQLWQQLGFSAAEPLSMAQQLVQIGAFADSYIVVIDGLDQVRDPHTLIELLSDLPRHCRFVFTTRRAPYDEGGSVIRLSELPFEQSKHIVRAAVRRAAKHSRQRTFDLSDEQWEGIYSTVGGVPLALNMLGYMLAEFDLAHVLEAARLPCERFTALYDYIYSDAWQQLSENGRDLMRFLASAPKQAATFNQLLKRDLSPVELKAAIREANALHLLEIGGTPEQATYRLLSLTYTFIGTGLPDRYQADTLEDGSVTTH